MFTDDLFEGWLSVPGIDELLATEVTNQREEAPAPSCYAEQSTQMSPQGVNGVNSTGTITRQLDRPHLEEFVHNIPQLPEAGPPPSDATRAETSARRRREHTKSRLGCISCKKRKVKCQETWPSCANCIKRGCICTYPTAFKYTQHERIVSDVLKTPRRPIQISVSPMHSTYSANDMRLFHHFIVAAHPCIPCEYEMVWIRDIPRFSHQYDYLMHGMLAIAGSHLDMFSDDPGNHRALLYRQKAIVGLEEAFTRWPTSADEAHVMLATSYLLAFQSSYLADGLLDHILSLRGCALLSQLILTNQIKGVFTIDTGMYGAWLEWRMESFPVFDQELAREALRSLAQFAPSLASSKAQAIERAMVAQLVEILRPLLVSTDLETRPENAQPAAPESNALSQPPQDEHISTSFPKAATNPLFPARLALNFEDITSWKTIAEVPLNPNPDPRRSFKALMLSLVILTTWPRAQVLALFSPTRALGSVLIAHFCCVRFITSPLWAPEAAMRTTPMRAMVEWCEKVVEAVADDGEVEWTRFVRWPRAILRTMRCLLDQRRGLTLGMLHEALRRDPGAFREGRAVRL